MTEVAPDTKKKVLQDISAAHGLSEPTLNQEWEKWSQQQTTAAAGLSVTTSIAKIKAWFMDHLTSQGMVTAEIHHEEEEEEDDLGDVFPVLDAGEYESGDEDDGPEGSEGTRVQRSDDSLDFLNDTTDDARSRAPFDRELSSDSGIREDMFKRAEARVLQRLQKETLLPEEDDEEDVELSQAKA